MHQGTPVLQVKKDHRDNTVHCLSVVHSWQTETDGSVKVWLYNSSMDILEPASKERIKLLNLSTFDPSSIIKLKWIEILSPELYIINNGDIFFIKEVAFRSRLARLLTTPLSHNSTKKEDINQIDPVNCWLPIMSSDDAAIGKTLIKVDYHNNFIVSAFLFCTTPCVFFDVSADIQSWTAHSIDSVHRALAGYDQFVTRWKKWENNNG